MKDATIDDNVSSFLRECLMKDDVESQNCLVAPLVVLCFGVLSRRDLFSIPTTLRNRLSAKMLQHQVLSNQPPPVFSDQSLLGVAR
jgi:hypothetical protein